MSHICRKYLNERSIKCQVDAKFSTTLESISEEVDSQYNFSFYVSNADKQMVMQTLSKAQIPFEVQRNNIALCLVHSTSEKLNLVRNLIKSCNRLE